jgi:hypothetical protein
MRTSSLTIVAGVFLLAQVARADDKASEPDFSRYPQTEAYKDAFHSSLRDSDVLAISAFAGSGGFVLEYRVDKTGREFDVRDVPDFALEASHSKQLSPDQMKLLEAAISELPSKNEYGPAENLVVVRVRQGSSSVTHCYDGKNLPKAVHDIYAVIGERFETAGIK